MTKVMQRDGVYYQEIHPFTDTGWIKFHRSLVTQVVPEINSLATLKVLMLFLEQTTDRRDRDVPAELSVRLIARKMKLSPTSAHAAIRELLDMGIVRVAIPGDRTTAAVYELNREFVLMERVEYVGDPGVSEVDTPRTGVSEVDTHPVEGVSEVDTPSAKSGGKVYQNLVQVIEEDLKQEEERERAPATGAGASRPTPKPAPVVIHGSRDRTPGGRAPYRGDIPADAPTPVDYRRAKPTPELLARQHPAVAAYWVAVGRHPQRKNESLVIEMVGSTPDTAALARAAELWDGSNHNMDNVVGILEWYVELRRNPAWLPSARFRGQSNPKAPTGADSQAVDAAWAAVLAAIRRTGNDRAVLDGLDEASRSGVRAAGNIRAIRNMQPGNNDRTIKAMFAAGYRDALDRAAHMGAGLVNNTQAAAAYAAAD
jgi:hypothetical protein